MSYYLTDDDISGAWYNGETVPGDNTITSAANTSNKSRITKYINTQVLLRTNATNATDTSGVLNVMAIDLYGQVKAGEKLFVEKKEARIARQIIKGIPAKFSDTREFPRGEAT